MRLKKIKNSDIIVRKSKYFIPNPQDYKGNWNKLFDNKNPIELEIGMGKGDFIISKAIDNPNINFIGFEKYDSVMVFATKKLESININNLLLVNEDAANLKDIFNREIDKIYLNFSDPWPKKRHAKRRLTHEKFLCIYDSIFIGPSRIEMKTDNTDLFEYSLESFKAHGYNIIEENRNIDAKHKTEYEKKFIENGKNINYVSIHSK